MQTQQKDGGAGSLIARRELIGSLVGRNLKIRYKGSALGFFWSLLTPLCFILIYAVFARLLKFGGSTPDYLQYLVAGIIVWQFTAGCLNDSLHSISGNANLVKKVFFPRVILPLSTALANLVNYLLTFAVLLLYLVVSGHAHLGACWLLAPAFAMHFALCFGLCCLCGTSNVFFRDTEHIVGVISQAWFFTTPVMYPVSFQLDFLPARLGWLAYLNPMTGVLALYRRAILGHAIDAGGSPWWAGVAASCAVCLAVLAAGRRVLKAGDARFGDVL